MMAFMCDSELPGTDNRRTNDADSTTDTSGVDERLRTQTLARYFTPAQITREIISRSGELVAPKLSKNTHITSLAQNGALRLNCDRAFVSLLDSSIQYIIAEATRSISIRDSNHYSSPSDALFLGVQALHKSYGVCPNTVTVFTDVTGDKAINTDHIVADNSRYVIRDMTKMKEYKDKPYVAGFPHMVSYAEVPLKSSDGYVIGTFCVSDTVVREDFFGEEAVFVLTEIAASIVEYLELVTVRHNHHRGERLMEGLSLFAEGKSGFLDKQEGQRASPTALVARRALEDQLIPDVENVSVLPIRDVVSPVLPASGSEVGDVVPAMSNIDISGADRDTEVFTNRGTSIADGDHGVSVRQEHLSADLSEEVKLQTSTGTLSSGAGSELPRAETKTKSTDPHRGRKSSSVVSGYSETFSRAANLIREAMDVEGLVFLDASPRNAHADMSRVTDVRADSTRDASSETGNSDDSTEKSPICTVLGSSSAPPADDPRQDAGHVPFKLHERSLRRLAKEYPRGHVFSADRHGELASPRSDHFPTSYATPDEVPDLDQFVSTTHSVIFFPLWDFSKAQFFAGLLAWTTDPTRVFEREDFTCLSAFGDSVMTELARLEALDLSRAKSDFISSVSHELRSPLHGILASAELLRDAVTDESQSEFVRMIESCGNTLLDTFNHLLDFAKLNSFDNSKGHARKDLKRGKSTQEDQGQTVVEDLAELVEDVVEGVYFGHISRKEAHQSSDSKHTSDNLSKRLSAASRSAGTEDAHVAVTVYIEKRTDWNMPLNLGAWKRVVMNLFANALKYTPRGYINISLKRIQTSSDSRRDVASLVVTDTGIGMSDDYLKHKLFKPFAQENSAADGTGLGLSIVKQIVNTFGGTVDVRSEAGVGTQIEVRVPLNTLATSSQLGEEHSAMVLHSTDPLQGRKLCFVGFGSDSSAEEMSTTDAKGKRRFTVCKQISALATEWFGMKVVSASDFQSVDADFYVAEVSSIADLTRHDNILIGKKRLLSVESEFPNITGKININGKTVSRIQYPIGPRTLGKALLTSLNNNDQYVAPTEPEGYNIRDEKQSEPHVPSTTLHEESKVGAQREQTNQDRRPHLLLVDDNSINLKILSTYVRKLGCTYETAQNGLEAVEIHGKSSKLFDIIFMDISMPVMNGFEASRRIRRFERGSASHSSRPTRIIALTGLGSVESRKEATDSGIDEFRTKPVPLKDLKSILDGP